MPGGIKGYLFFFFIYLFNNITAQRLNIEHVFIVLLIRLLIYTWVGDGLRERSVLGSKVEWKGEPVISSNRNQSFCVIYAFTRYWYAKTKGCMDNLGISTFGWLPSYTKTVVLLAHRKCPYIVCSVTTQRYKLHIMYISRELINTIKVSLFS